MGGVGRVTELPPPSQAEERGRALGQTRSWGRRPRGYEALRREGEPPHPWTLHPLQTQVAGEGFQGDTDGRWLCGHIGVRHEAVKTF